jgi:asparagine synthase (glutamine-hydrolysing)
MAAQLGTRHVEAPVTRSMFIERWPEMVAQQGIPLSTPNEVAINEVARRLRADGMVVALSGEGADELFGGYEIPLSQARQFESARATIPTTSAERARFQLLGNAWIPPETWTAILTPDALAAVSGESLLFDRATGIFSEIADDRDAGEGTSVDAAMQSHLRFQRRVNLTGLLGRLDTATMLASVEGRTPLADARIASLAECLPMASKYVPAGDTHPARTKIALRDAFADVLPAAIVDRPKASFPLPFQTWIGDVAPVLRESSLAREIFTEAAIETVAARTGELWTLAWPMVNIALWGKRWWG